MAVVFASMQGIDLNEGLSYAVRLTLFGIFIIAMSGISAAFGIGILAGTLGYAVGVNFTLPLRGINTTLLSGFGVILTVVGIVSLISGLITLVYKLIVDAVSRGAQMASNSRSKSQSRSSQSKTNARTQSNRAPPTQSQQQSPTQSQQSPQSRSTQRSTPRSTQNTDSETTPGRR